MQDKPDGTPVDVAIERAKIRALTIIRLGLEKLGAQPPDIDEMVAKVFARVVFHRIGCDTIVGFEKHPERGFVLNISDGAPFWMTQNLDLSWQLIPPKPEPIRPTPPYLRPLRASRA